jgi:hypothetical protein
MWQSFVLDRPRHLRPKTAVTLYTFLADTAETVKTDNEPPSFELRLDVEVPATPKPVANPKTKGGPP